VKQVPLLLYL